jgi:pimeloyl-ACP methyl ester carboxylesterase
MSLPTRAKASLTLATTAALGLSLVQAPAQAAPPDPRSPTSDVDLTRPLGEASAGATRRDADHRPASPSMVAATPTVPLRPCADDPAWLCGTVSVPFDRRRPEGRSLALAFAVLPRSDPDATATDALVMSDGGPGIANIANKGFLQFLAGDLTESRDLVVVDHRGTGRSSAIDCPDAQRLAADPFASAEANYRAIGRCGRQLGDGADRYGGGDVALDIEAVRRALGYPAISLYGLSYGGVFVGAYAARFPDRLRAAVIDSGTPVTDPRHAWTWGMDVPRATAAGIALDCRRAPACAASQPDARTALARIARAVRRDPVRGTAVVPGLGRRRLVVDEAALVRLATDWRNAAELAAVASALDDGDTRPLLRLAGESFQLPGDPVDPEIDSIGNNVAVFCNDVDPVWERTDPFRVRRLKYERALARLGQRHAFAPYSVTAWTDYFLAGYCLRWPAPDRFVPAIPAGASVEDVPTLILSGDRDTQVPTSMVREWLRVFPDASFVRVPGAAHAAAGWSGCAGDLVHDFVRRLAAAVGTCTEPAQVLAAASTFPSRAADAVPATSGGTVLRRRIVTVAVQTVRDAWMRSFHLPGESASFPGLRGGRGRFDYSGWPTATITLRGSRYAVDVAVSGTSTYLVEENRLTFEIGVDGPGRLDGTLRAEGGFGFGPVYEDFVVEGALGGQVIRATVPAN